MPITATNAPAASSGGQGTSTITLPIGALGATAIKVDGTRIFGDR
ncbi:hypothetical protein [Budvicia aquatica]|nr:hypothetical protein [Budvicia aquatica]